MTLRGTLGRTLGLVALLAALVGCGGKQPATGTGPTTLGNPAASIPAAPTLGPSVGIPFPDERSAAGLTETTILGKDAEQRSSGATELSTALVLDATASGAKAQYALYRFKPAGQALDSVSVLLAQPSTTGAYLGLPDYATGRWHFSGPYAQHQSLILDGPANLSPTGELWVAILVNPGDRAQVNALSVRTTTPDDTPPVVGLTVLPASKGPVGDPILLDASASFDPNLGPLTFDWDLDGDGTYETSSGHAPTQQLVLPAMPGPLTASVRVTNDMRLATAVAVQLLAYEWVDKPLPYHDSGPYLIPKLLGQVDDRPAAVWSDPVPSQEGQPFLERLYFGLASDAAVSGWQAPVQIDEAYALGQLALTDVYGKPALSYGSRADRGWDDTEIRYTRAADATGASWNAPLALPNPDGLNIYGVSMAMVNGCPAVAYTQYEIVRYLRADDLYGQSWTQNSQAVTSTGGYTTTLILTPEHFSAAAIVLDGATIVYSPNGNSWTEPQTVQRGHPLFVDPDLPLRVGYWVDDRLEYTTSSHAEPLWTDPVVVASQVSDGGSCFAMVGGRPAALYCENGDPPTLRFVWAKDKAGTAWDLPEVVDTLVAGALQLTDAGGAPLIAYRDQQNHLQMKRRSE